MENNLSLDTLLTGITYLKTHLKLDVTSEQDPGSKGHSSAWHLCTSPTSAKPWPSVKKEVKEVMGNGESSLLYRPPRQPQPVPLGDLRPDIVLQ